jgi:predicted CoA-binding protein
MAMTFQNPNREEISSLLLAARTIAVVGLSDNPSRPSFDVAAALLSYGYRVIPVTPRLKVWEGIDAVPDLATAKATLGLDARIDIVNVFRQSQHVAGIVDDCLRLALPALWLQLGVIDDLAAMRAQSSGMTVIMNKCIKVERMRI